MEPPGHKETPGSAAVIVAHPDDEVLWAGGTILSSRDCSWFVVTLCRGTDTDRAPKFSRVLKCLGAAGAMADLDDGPAQSPLDDGTVQDALLAVLPTRRFDLVLTHGPSGEYTRHRRHEEVSRAVVALWLEGRITAESLWMFAYEDGGKRYLPRPHASAHRRDVLSEPLYAEKKRLITDLYGFSEESWEANAATRVEAFWCFDSPDAAQRWIEQKGAGQ